MTGSVYTEISCLLLSVSERSPSLISTCLPLSSAALPHTPPCCHSSESTAQDLSHREAQICFIDRNNAEGKDLMNYHE
jgi:hypothetical protein